MNPQSCTVGRRLACRVLGSLLLALTLSVGATVGSPLLGDVVKTIDGKEFEGKILSRDDKVVRVDTLVSGIRIQIGVPAREIEAVETKDLPAGFFETSTAAAARVSKPSKFPEGTELFLEIPIVGIFGKQVVADGVKRALSYAAAHKIPHVVFFVDSQGGDRIAAGDIYEILSKYEGKVKYHAVVRDSVGVAMAVTVWCDEVFVLPGANLGGVILDLSNSEEDADVLRSQIAFEVGQEAEKHGWPAPLVRAMIDPEETVAAWRDENGKIATSPRVPTTLPTKNVVVHDRPGSVLTLNSSQAAGLGLARAFNGAVDDLGKELGLELWTRESDYGRTAVVEASQIQQKREQKISSRKEDEIARLIKRRTSVKRFIDRQLALAHSWDPEQSAYSKYDQYSSKWESYWGGGQIDQTITAPRWRELTDTTVAALVHAHNGVVEMRKLDAKAESLGLDPMYPPGELDKVEDDIAVKVKLLQYWRNRKTRSS